MKDKIKKLSLYIFIIISCIFGISNVYAEDIDLTMENTGYYWDAIYANGTHHSSYFRNYSFNGRVAYCIEPGVTEGDTYTIGDWNNTDYTDEQKSLAMLYTYYGYDYPGHQTQKYRVATQVLLWEMFGKSNITISTKLWAKGTVLDISTEKAEILRLVSEHYKKPSFNGEYITLKVGQSYTFTDTNNILSEYNVTISDNVEYTIDGNNLTVTPLTTGTITISLSRKIYSEKEYLVYYGRKIQTMMSSGYVDPVYAAVSVNSEGGSVEFYKKDVDNLSYIGEATLEGAVYGVYNASTGDLISKVTTDSNGYAKYDNLPYLGDYYLKEISASKGYELDTDLHYFSSTKEELNVVVDDVYEKIIEREIELTKVYATNESKIMTPEVGVEFGFYDNNNNLVTKGTTDENGKITLKLVYGTYTVKQLTTSYGTEKVKDFTITVSESGNKFYYTISNAEISAKLRVVKVDSETKEVIKRAGIKFKIYDVENEEYVCQTTSYPKQTICEFETDENGEFITAYPLQAGTYRLEEVDQVIDGYLWNSVSKVFTIDENSKLTDDSDYGIIFDVQFENTPVKGEVVIEKVGEVATLVEGEGYSYKYVNLEGVEFGLYQDEKLIAKGTTDKDGYLKFENLSLGTYCIKELSTLDGYVINTDSECFELKYKDQYTPVVTYSTTIQNKVKTTRYEFTKTDYSTEETLPNTKMEIYTIDDELVYSGITDEDGQIIIDRLPIGKYYILESEAPEGYLVNEEKLYFEVKGEEVIKSNMKDKKITGTLEFTKTDFSESIPLPNTTIEIYNDKDELIYTGTTDENGKIIVEELEYGKYYILEKNAPEGYTLNTERMYFEIKNDGEIVKCIMKDEKIIEVPITGKNEIPFIEIGSSLLCIAGIGVVIYAKKKRK